MGSCFSFFCRIFSGVFSFLGAIPRVPNFAEIYARGGRGLLQTVPWDLIPPGGHTPGGAAGGSGTPWRGPVGPLRRRAHPWAGGGLPAGTRGGARRRFPPGTGGARPGRRRGGKTGRRVWAGTAGLWRARARGRAVPRRRGGAAAHGANGAKSGGPRGRARRRLFRRDRAGGYTAGGGAAAQHGRRQRRRVSCRGV